jgi:hypothetical protein
MRVGDGGASSFHRPVANSLCRVNDLRIISVGKKHPAGLVTQLFVSHVASDIASAGAPNMFIIIYVLILDHPDGHLPLGWR